MIKNLSIENFKSLKKVDVSLSNLNILMGLNGMGKSSFIQSLLLLKQSKKLEEGILDLNGNLVQIGKGKDALYQFTKREKIYFALKSWENINLSWEFSYQNEKEYLKDENENLIEQAIILKNVTKNFQYISAERLGPKDIYDSSSAIVEDERQLGLLGEYAAYFINVFGEKYEVNEKLRHPKAVSNNLIHQINAWMKEISPGVSINTLLIPTINKVILNYKFDLIIGNTNLFNPKNVGFGITYVLPVVLALLTAEEGKIIVIENPESHIHPRGQAELGKLISLATNVGAQLFIETHSDHILNGIRVAVKENLVSNKSVNIMYFDKVTTEVEQYSKITQIKVDKNGELNEYPINMLDEWGNQLFKLM